MNSVIFSTATRYLLPLLLLFSVFILFRGHNEPGGGFIGGLAAASAFAMYAIAFDVDKARRLIWINPIYLIAIGLTLALIGGLMGLVSGYPFMTGIWASQYLPIIGKPGSPLVFDIGVYLVVIGITVLIVFTLAEEE